MKLQVLKPKKNAALKKQISNLTEALKTHISSQRQPVEEQHKPVAAVTRDASTFPENSHIITALRDMSTSTSDLEVEPIKQGVAVPGLIVMPTATDKSTSNLTAASNLASATSTSSSAGKPSSPATAVEPFPASVLSCPKVCVTLDDIHSCTQFSKLGSRELCFYSKAPFKFGRLRHNANLYPNPLPAFLTNIVSTLRTVDKDFSLEHYSCMIEKYRDGSSTFLHHTDPDAFLESTSNIYNVLIGAEREVEFMNLTGAINPLRIKISDGSIYSIPASSQGSWSRCLISNPSIKNR